MTLQITYTAPGRGAWSTIGGTLSLDGSSPGMNYRSATGGMPVIGESVYHKHRSSTVHTVHINEVAVWRAAMAIQKAINSYGLSAPLVIDGRIGPATDAAARVLQGHLGIRQDGVIGPQTCKTIFSRMLDRRLAAWGGAKFMPHHKDFMVDLCSALITLESGWDPGAVGYSTPHDLGISQINTEAHDVNPLDMFDPVSAFDTKLSIVLDNFHAALYDIPLAVVAYNGGLGGAEAWHNAGRPGFGTGWGTPDDWAPKYLRAVARHATHPDLVTALAPWKE